MAKPENDTTLGLFLPIRMAKKTKRLMLETFKREGRHTSPTGFTARLICAECVRQGVPFTLNFYNHEDFGCYFAVTLSQDAANKFKVEVP